MIKLSFRLICGGLLFGCLTSAAVASKSVKPKIIGGVEAKAGDWPWMTAMVTRGRDAFNGQACGASFIGKRYVLTASHCVEGASANQLDVVVGIHDLNKEASQGQRIAVTNIYMHENYSSPVELNNDIAVLELSREVENITPIKTMTDEILTKISAGTELTVMGWGNRSTTGTDYPNILHQVKVPLYDRAACKAAYPELTDEMICAGFTEGGKDSCQGDSGGPLVVNYENEWYQIGVVSYGDGCAVAGKPGVYANVAKFEDWIKQKMAGVSLPTGYQLGYVEQGYSGQQSITLTNYTEAPLNIGNAVINNIENLDSPVVAADSCSGQSIAINASCEIQVNFKASQSGQAKFSLKIDTDNALVNQVSSKVSLHALPQASFDINGVVESSGINWFTQSSGGWEMQSTQTVEGGSGLQSGSIGDGQSSVLLAVIDNASQLSINYKTSTEADYDLFNIYVDGETKLSKSGAMSTFEKLEVELKPGTNRLMFVYAKDSEQSDNDDKVYLDKLSFSSSANQSPMVRLDKESIRAEEGSSVQLNAASSSDPEGDSLTFQWTQESGNSVSLNNANSALASFTAPNVDSEQQLVFKVTVTDSKGNSAFKTILVIVTNKSEPTNPTTPEQPQSSSGGGSFSIFLLAGLLLLGRRKTPR